MKKLLLSILTLMSLTSNAGYETGTANQVLRVPSGGGRPKYGQVNVASSAAVTGALAIANGGTGQTTKDAYLNKAVTSKTTTYAATSSDDVILASGSAFTITLPAAASNSGKVLIFKKTDSSFTNIITIDGNSSETIDTALTTTLNTQGEQLMIVCDGSNWHVLERLIPGAETTYTPVITHTSGGITNHTVSGAWSRRNDKLIGRVLISLSSAPASFTNIIVSLPSGLTIDTTKLLTSSPNQAGVGTAGMNDSNSSLYGGQTLFNTTSTVKLFKVSTVSGTNPVNVQLSAMSATDPFALNTGDVIFGNFEVPISGWN